MSGQYNSKYNLPTAEEEGDASVTLTNGVLSTLNCRKDGDDGYVSYTCRDFLSVADRKDYFVYSLLVRASPTTLEISPGEP